MTAAQVDAVSLAAGFLEILFDECDREWIDVRLIEEHKGGNCRQLWFRGAASLLARLPALASEAYREGRAVFFGVLPRRERGNGTRSGVGDGWVAWADVDFKDVTEAEARERLRALPCPSIEVRSGHGMHLYWLMQERTAPGVLEDISRRVAAAIGADSCFDSARVLRLPGTRNLKEGWAGGTYAQPAAAPVVLMPECDPSRRYQPHDFDLLPEVEPTSVAVEHAPRSGRQVDGLPMVVSRLLRRHEWLRHLWAGTGRATGDTSNSGYDLAFAGALTRCGIVDADVLDAAVRARPYRATGNKAARTERDVQRVVDRALADARARLPREAPVLEPPCDGDDAPPPGDADAPPSEGAFDEGAAPPPSRGHASTQPELAVSVQLARQVRKVDGDLVPGRPLPSALNVEVVLAGDPRWKRWLRYNEFTGRVEIDGKQRTDVLDTKAALWLHRVYDLEVSTDRVAEVLRYVAETRYAYDPVRQYLDALAWDGVGRVDTILQRAFAVVTPDVSTAGGDPCGDELVSSMARVFFVSAVARVFAPGCKVDTTLVLVGAQGKGKSTALAALCPRREWFSDTQIDMRDKDRFQALQGVWIMEHSEMDFLRGAALSRFKGFLSSQVDRYRASYGRNVEDYPRRTVFVGSTNEHEFVDDPTGMRRFMPLRVAADRPMDVATIITERDQLWAEAVAMYRAGMPWHMGAAAAGAMRDHAEGHRVVSPWEDHVRGFLADPARALAERDSGFTAADVLAHLGLPLERQDDRNAVMRVTALLTALGCTKARARGDDGARRWRWFRPGHAPTA